MSDQPISRKLGAKPRAFNPSMPHAMSVRMMVRGDLPLIPEKHNYLDGMPDDLGMMLNNVAGCCTAAGAYHAGQVASFHGRRKLLTEPDKYVAQMYSEFTGWDGVPGSPSDQGGVEQDILRQWITNGIPIQEGYSEAHPEPGRSYLRAAMEVSPRVIDSVKRAIFDCSVVYIGMDVPNWLMSEPTLPEFWDSAGKSPRQLDSVGGHCVTCHGYEDRGVWLISWGKKYLMSWAMFREAVSEVYALVLPWWITATGQTPFGLPADQLADQMAAFCGRHVAAPRK